MRQVILPANHELAPWAFLFLSFYIESRKRLFLLLEVFRLPDFQRVVFVRPRNPLASRKASLNLARIFRN